MTTDNRKKLNLILKIVYPVILVIYPIVRAWQGLNVADATYSPANFVFFDSMSGTWTVATFLANLTGSLITRLPFGYSLLGLNIYTSLIVSLTALVVFWGLRRDINIHILFAGEIVALSLCWCPSVILYNYLTYFLFNCGALLLWSALRGGDHRRLVFAGVVLGVNALTRLPNVTEAALIIVLWFAGYIDGRSIRDVLKDTLRCIVGYLIGFIIIFALICVRYSPSAYILMIRNMFAMTDKASDYKPLAMVWAIFKDYIYAGRWIAFWIAGLIVFALLLFCFRQVKGRSYFYVAFGAVIFGFVIRICYGRGMFSFRYYEYGSMYFWAVLLLLAATLACVICIVISKSSDRRILSLIVLITIYVTCIGSNNGLYPIVNNMFIVAPYILWMLYETFRGMISDGEVTTIQQSLCFSAAVTAALLFAGTLIQGVGFHFGNAFNDGIYGEPRDSYVTGYKITAGIRTTAANAATLQGLMDHMYAHRTEDDSLILYGDIPGLGYLLDMPSALSTFWPDLDSYNYEEWVSDMAAYGSVSQSDTMPYIIVTPPAAAVCEADSDAIAYFGAEADRYKDDVKLTDLAEFIRAHSYRQVYVNDAYVVYSSR